MGDIFCEILRKSFQNVRKLTEIIKKLENNKIKGTLIFFHGKT